MYSQVRSVCRNHGKLVWYCVQIHSSKFIFTSFLDMLQMYNIHGYTTNVLHQK